MEIWILKLQDHNMITNIKFTDALTFDVTEGFLVDRALFFND